MADDPSTPSAEYIRMEPKWRLVSDILDGVETVRRRGDKYLPKFEIETSEEYRRRSESAPWRPEFGDILQTLASKPFGRDVSLKGNVPDEIAGVVDPATKARRNGIVDDVDGRGSSLTTFAAEAFFSAIAKGGHAILVDYPEMAPNASRAEEIAVAARPYWVQIPIDNIIALYTEMQGGREVIVHVRIKETKVERDGFGEKTVNQIRVLEPGTSQLFIQGDQTGAWVPQEVRSVRVGGKTGVVPLALLFIGKRLGTQEVRPPLQDCAQMQIELYQALSREEEVLTFAGFPMLAGNGLGPPPAAEGKIAVGPKTILFTGAGDGKAYWSFVQPDAANIAEIRKSVEAIQADMRRIGLQPLTESPGNPTATGKAIEAAKAHSAVKSWALLLNDTLERAFDFTCEYLGKPATVQTEVSTDFSVLPYAAEPLKALAEARAVKEISHDAYVAGLKRFDVLPNDFDASADKALILAEPPVPEQTTVQIRT